MKNKKGIILSIFLVLIGIAIIIINMILKSFNWYLRGWIMMLAPYLISFGIAILGIFALKTIKQKWLKILFITLWILFCILVMFMEFLLLSWFIKSDIVKEIDNTKYVGVQYYSNRLRKTVIYYKEYNIFAYHKTEEYIEEFYDYDDYEQAEWREYHKIPRTDSIIYYYDEDGNITNIKTYNENGAIVDVDSD